MHHLNLLALCHEPERAIDGLGAGAQDDDSLAEVGGGDLIEVVDGLLVGREGDCSLATHGYHHSVGALCCHGGCVGLDTRDHVYAGEL